MLRAALRLPFPGWSLTAAADWLTQGEGTLSGTGPAVNTLSSYLFKAQERGQGTASLLS